MLAVVVGLVDDRVALARELALAPASAQHVLVAAGYRRWGAELVQRLRGAFTLLVWDGRQHRGLLAVDQLGARSLFYCRTGRFLAFAADVRELLPLLAATPPPSERAVVRWLVDGVHEPHETLLAGVERLPGGHLLRIGRVPAPPERYWRPLYRTPPRVDFDAAAGAVRSGLARAVTRACQRRPPIGVLLSGGIDSSAVAAFARASAEQLVAYSALFPNHAATDESALIAARARALGLPAGSIAFRRGGAMPATLRYLDAWRLPPASPNLFFHELLLDLAREEGMESMLDGQGGDELFGLSPFLATDRLLRGRLREVDRLLHIGIDSRSGRSAARRAAFRGIVLKGAVPSRLHRLGRGLRRQRRNPVWLTDVGAKLYAGGRSSWEWKAIPGPRWWAYLADTVTVARERAGVHDFLRHAFARSGLVGAHPLLEDVDLVETVLALPPEHAWHERHDRPVLREAVRGLLPDPIRFRPDKSFFDDVLAFAVRVEDAAAADGLLSGRTEVSRYVRPELFAQLRATRESTQGRRGTWLLWRLATLECWLRMQADADFAQRASTTSSLVELEATVSPSRAAYRR